MRDQRNIRKVAGPLPSGREIEWILPDSEITTRALEVVPEQVRQNPAAAISQAQQNQLRMCLERIGDEEVTWTDLRGGGLDHYFAPTELDMVEEAFQHSIRPTDEETAFFDEQLEQFQEDGEWRWRSRILLGEDLEAFREAESRVRKLEFKLARADKDDDDGPDPGELREKLKDAEAERDLLLEEALELEGRPLDSETTRRCTESIPRQYAGDPALTAKLAQDQMCRQVLVSIDGTDVDPVDLAGTDLDEALHPKEQHLIIEGVSELSTPDREEVDDFLSTVRDG